jgi:hypothetical protein
MQETIAAVEGTDLETRWLSLVCLSKVDGPYRAVSLTTNVSNDRFGHGTKYLDKIECNGATRASSLTEQGGGGA